MSPHVRQNCSSPHLLKGLAIAYVLRQAQEYGVDAGELKVAVLRGALSQACKLIQAQLHNRGSLPVVRPVSHLGEEG